MNIVAIHNKNGKGLLQCDRFVPVIIAKQSQSTIKMEKGYYSKIKFKGLLIALSQSTIKMEKGYYWFVCLSHDLVLFLSQSTIKMEKGYYICTLTNS